MSRPSPPRCFAFGRPITEKEFANKETIVFDNASPELGIGSPSNEIDLSPE